MTRKQREKRPPEGARKAAWRILLEWETGTEALEAIRDSYFKKALPEPRDRALVTELTQGAVRHRLFIDHTVKDNLSRPDLTLPGPVTTALHLGAYQLIHLHKIPAHAAVKETVQIIKDSRFRRFTSLVNAVLRRIADKGPTPVPSFESDPAAHIVLATSTPEWLVDLVMGAHGSHNALRIFQALNRPPPITLRVNSSRISREDLIARLDALGIPAVPGKLAASAVILDDRTPLWDFAPFREGLCTVQDEGAQVIAPLLCPEPGQRILDACAAPGGKTGHLAQLTAGQAFIAAVDKNRRRIPMVAETLRRLGSAGTRLLVADLTRANCPFGDRVFDLVLLDVPCSGTGVLRRHPEGKWKKDLPAISKMAEIQGDLLVSTGQTLKEGGRILYTTCSLLEKENEEVVDRFLAGNGLFKRIDMRAAFPEMRQDVFTGRGELRLWPHIHQCDGFYACLMERGS